MSDNNYDSLILHCENSILKIYISHGQVYISRHNIHAVQNIVAGVYLGYTPNNYINLMYIQI